MWWYSSHKFTHYLNSRYRNKIRLRLRGRSIILFPYKLSTYTHIKGKDGGQMYQGSAVYKVEYMATGRERFSLIYRET